MFNQDGAHTRATDSLHKEIEELKTLAAMLAGGLIIFQTEMPGVPAFPQNDLNRLVPDWRERTYKTSGLMVVGDKGHLSEEHFVSSMLTSLKNTIKL